MRSNRTVHTLVMLTAALLIGGCRQAHVTESHTVNLASGEEAGQLEFWHSLATRRLTSNDEAFQGLLLFVEADSAADSYAARVEALNARGMLPANFDRPADEVVHRGTLAVALVKALNIKGGVVMQVIGPTPRYATRELQHLNIYPPSSPQQTFRGDEFLFVIGRAEDFQRLAKLKASAQNMPGE